MVFTIFLRSGILTINIFIGNLKIALRQRTSAEEVIGHKKIDSSVYLLIRESKLRGKTAAPFTFYGEVTYESHESEKPMNVTRALLDKN